MITQLHRPDRTHHPRLVAHRGASQECPENTLSAVIEAARSGADAIEVDVRLTADKIPVLLHDTTLVRMWNDPRHIAATPWREIRALRYRGEAIPRLTEVINALAGTRSTLLLDVDSPECAAIACEQVMATPVSLRVEWCGSKPAMAQVRALDPQARIWYPWASLDIPTAADLGNLRPVTLNIDAAFLTARTTAAAHELGLDVACWTVDQPQAAQWAAQLGVDSITTNALSLLQGVLRSAADDSPERRSEASEQTESQPSIDEVIERAVTLATRIAQETISFTREQEVTKVIPKSHAADIVTNIDRTVEREIRRAVRQIFPYHSFHGEEYGTAPGNSFSWYLDPVDGTTNLANGIPWTSMSLCLAHETTPLVGVVADPWRGEIFEARRGGGAHLGAHRLRAGVRHGNGSLAGTTVGTELDAHCPWPGLSSFIGTLAEHMCTTRIMGSGTLALTQVAAGRGAGACVSAFHAIDHGAAVLLVHESDGVVATPDGPISGFPDHGIPVLVSAPEVFAELFTIWRNSIRVAD